MREEKIKVRYVRVVRSGCGISPWVPGMEGFVNDGEVYTVYNYGHSGSPRLNEAGYYFPIGCLQFLTEPEVFAHLNKGYKVKK